MRCYKCNGCVSSFDPYIPEWCNDPKCPQGNTKEPEKERYWRLAILDPKLHKQLREKLKKENEESK